MHRLKVTVALCLIALRGVLMRKIIKSNNSATRERERERGREKLERKYNRFTSEVRERRRGGS